MGNTLSSLKGAVSKVDVENNVIKLQIRYLAIKMVDAKDEKFSWSVVDKKTNKPYDKWATMNLEERVAKSTARRLNKQLTLKTSISYENDEPKRVA